jgi:hypothetical protein
MTLPYWMIYCKDCGKKTTKSYANQNHGKCKSCKEGKTQKQKLEAIDKEPVTTFIKNFKGHGAHWQAEIFEDSPGWSAVVTCISSPRWNKGYKTNVYNLESVEKLCECIKDDLKNRETPGGIMFHAKGD